MCGVAGSVSIDGSSRHSLTENVRTMMAHMERRGPDGEGVWVSKSGRVALGHRRLAIIDLSDNGLQPMVSASGRSVISFNGEIYNYRELRRELVKAGARFNSTSDTEVILELYERYGTGFLRRLRGMFAFALYDLAASKLILVRDPYGIKPLYYSQKAGMLQFCSQVTALKGVVPDPSLDAAGVSGFLLCGAVPEPFTLFREIRSLQAGCFLTWSEGHSIEVQEFGSVTKVLEKVKGNPDLVRRRDIHFRDLFRSTVDHHMVSDVEAHVFLSSGKDSVSVAALASEGRRNVQAITIGFPEFEGTPSDEVPLAREVAKSLRIDHRVIRFGLGERAAVINEFMNAMDQPTVDGFNTFLVSGALKSVGGKIALTGVGGDELLQGYSTFQTIPSLVRFCGNWAVKTLLSGESVRHALSPMAGRSLPYKADGVFALGATMAGGYQLRRGIYLPWELPALLGQATADEGLQELALSTMLNGFIGSIQAPALQICSLETQCYLRNQLLRDSDWAGMHSSIEIRTPLVDYSLLQDIVSGVEEWGWPGKESLLSSVEFPLPKGVKTKKKTGFSIPEFDPTAAHTPSQTASASRRWAMRVLESYLGRMNMPVTTEKKQ